MFLSVDTRHWSQWLSHTPLSVWLQHKVWLVPTSQSIHIVSVSVVFASALVISFRIMGLGISGRSVPQLVKSLSPWMYGALAVLLATGVLQTIIEPRRQFNAKAFWIKMVLVVIAVLITTVFVRRVAGDGYRWDAKTGAPPMAKLFAIVSLALWVGIIYCGRFIGYSGS